MADLTGVERRAFERLLGMVSGYVLEFSNRTFSEFVFDSTGRDIYDTKYDYGSGSKANRLRGFWNEVELSLLPPQRPLHACIVFLADGLSSHW